MDRMLYLAMNGAKQNLLAQTANSHNLANVNTVGFRQDLLAFQSAEVVGPGHLSRTYALARGPGTDLSAGPVVTTGRDLDVAVNGDGWLAVQAPDGTEAYTRAGDLRINSGGLLTTGAGHQVIGNGGPIAVPPFESMTIASDGSMSIRPVGEDATSIVPVDRLKLVNPGPAALFKGADGLMRLAGGGVAPADAEVRVAPGARESSNVNAVDALVTMIDLARNYELNVKLMRVAEENDAADAQILRSSA
ncbi:MAG: flagellar basal body rod protein FlgF [Chromatiales bacterium]|jgi:flagellar basal-body rod protein FlgF|nr:flagellar basal body rod protein FlgF [Chromatiales bacterium]